MTTTGIYTPNSGQMPVTPSNASSTQAAPAQPQSNLPWQMMNFKSWYNNSRGNWSDVSKAAQTDPNVRKFMGHLAKELTTGPFQTGPQLNVNHAGEDEFDIEAPTKQGTLADELENMVKKVIPQHGYNQRDPASPPVAGARPAMGQPQAFPSSALGIASNSPASASSQLQSKLQDMRSRSNDPNMASLIDVVRHLMTQIDDIERRVKSTTKTVA